MRGTQFFLPLVEAVSVTDLSYLIALKLSRACIRYVLFCEDLQFLGSDSNKNDSVVYKFKKRRMN